MDTDAEGRMPDPPRVELWALPKIVEIRAVRVRYRQPRQHMFRGQVVDAPEGVEFLVRTDGEIPVRALAAALYVGDVELAESEQVEENLYRFTAFPEEADRLQPGAPIGLGWVGYPERRARTRYRFRIAGEETR
ncbi:MAG TPA: hypothetical protein VFR15_17880 [Chloroflexia bacterium]|nr:hypothetical protein [Chloroflexia bacterium]